MRRAPRLSAILVPALIVGLLSAGTATASGGRVVASTTGGGTLLVGGALEVSFHFNAIARQDGSASGRFFHSVVVGGQLVEFRGVVTCVTMDADNHRAWVGGVVTANNSDHPGWLSEVHEVGDDIWFRVHDAGEGASPNGDRSTFVGFEGAAGIITSAEYCATQPWPDGNAGTNPLVQGNIQVHD